MASGDGRLSLVSNARTCSPVMAATIATASAQGMSLRSMPFMSVASLKCASPRLFVEWSLHQEVHGRRCFVARDESLAEVTSEVVVGGLGPRPRDPTDAIGERLLQGEAGERSEDGPHLFRRD